MKKSTLKVQRLGLLLAAPAALTLLAVTSSFNMQSEKQATAAPPTEKEVKTKANKGAKKSLVTFNKDGELERPTDYRRWTYIGTPVTPNDMNGGKAPFPEFHSVYINPGAYDHYEKTGKFPDGTVIVKELISVGAKEASSGNGYFMGEFIGLEVSMKDKTRYKDEPGNWAYFSFGHKYPLKDRAKVQPAASCNECHDGEADDDFVFTQYYPALRALKKALKVK